MAITINSSYAGDHAGQYIAAALKSATSLEYLTVLENIKYKRAITKVAGSSLVQDSSCDFDEAGTLALTERSLEPKNFKINTDLCRETLLQDWQAAQMRAGANNSDLSDDFGAFVVSYMAATIADHVEGNIWAGNAGTGGEFVGFMHAGNGLFENDAAIVEADNSGGAGTAFTAGNIIANLGILVAAVPGAVYTKEDLYIYMSPTTYRLYINAISALSAFPFNHMGQYTPEFEGVKIAVCPGMVENKMVAAQQSNLFFGTDLVSDHSEIKIMDMRDLDGSDNVRVVVKYSAGVQHAQGGDIVRLD